MNILSDWSQPEREPAHLDLGVLGSTKIGQIANRMGLGELGFPASGPHLFHLDSRLLLGSI